MSEKKNIRFNRRIVQRFGSHDNDAMDGLFSLLKTVHCYHKVQSYIAYAAKTAGRRGMTVLDVITDLNTFLILWRDPQASYWACFLLSSILLPYIIFWSSSHNFENATRAHTSFNRRPPTNVGEHITRIFYYLAALPILGLFVSFVQILLWWTCEMVLGLFHQRLHRKLVTRMEIRERVRLRLFRNEFREDNKFRQLPLLPSKNAARYLTIIELFFESIPQSILQLYIYLGGTSSYFTLQDVAISIGASLLNIVMNTRTIVQDAHCVGMSVFDYIVYFMGDRIGEMLTNLVPVNKILVSDTLHVCDLTGCDIFYDTDIPARLSRILQECEAPAFHKTIVLPAIRSDMPVPPDMVHTLLDMVVQVRHKENLHLTFATDNKVFLHSSSIDKQFQHNSVASYVAQRGETNKCVERCQGCLNYIACCRVQLGDLVCGERKRTVDEMLNKTSRYKPPRSATCCAFCCRSPSVPRSRRQSGNTSIHVIGLVKSVWPLLTHDGVEPYTGSLVNLMLFHALATDYAILKYVRDNLEAHGALGMPFQQLLDHVVKGQDIEEKKNGEESEWNIILQTLVCQTLSE